MASVGHAPASDADTGQDPSDLVRHFHDGGFFVARTPLLPFSVLIDWNEPEPQQASSEAGEPFDVAQRAVLVERLRTVFGQAELAEALFFASPSLLDKVEAWLRGKPWPGLELTLSRYLVRLATRSTPFGIFAGVSLGRVADTTCLELSGKGSYRRHTRPSMGFVNGVVDSADRSKDVQASSTYHPNSTLHCVYGRYRYTRVTREGVANPLLDVEHTPELERALETARNGATLETIAAAVQPLACTPHEALEYAQELVDQGIVVPTWLPAVTGPEPFDDVYRALSQTSMHAVAERLHSVGTRLDAADMCPLGEQLSQLRALARELEHGAPNALPLHALQADLLKPAPAMTLGRSVVRQLLRAAELVQRTNTPAVDPRMAEFRIRFVERYDSRMVPLMEALDEDLGIGFDHLQKRSDDSLVEGLGLRSAPRSDAADGRHALLLRMLTRALRLGGTSYELDAKMLDAFPAREHAELPESFAVMAHLGSGSGGPIVVSPALIAPSGLALLARFGHASEPLRQAFASQARAEQACAGQRLLMDVAHLPSGSIGNVLLRPVLRDAELVYGGRSGASAAARITISDLHITVVGQRIELYSARLGKPVSVRITNAHNYEGWWNLPVYRFLGALQRSEGAALATGWSWGLLESSPFLPRVVCEGIVLRRARWRLAADELEPLLDGNAARSRAAVQALRTRLALPRWIAVAPDETPLVVDLDNRLAVEMLVHEVRAVTELTLDEVLPVPDQLAVGGPEGRFAAEVIVPFVAKASKPYRSSWSLRGELATTPRAARSLVPGSDWLYAKIYVGASELQPVVQAIVRDVLPGLSESGAPRWFFVPFADPDLHLRLRIRLPEASVQQEAIARLRSAFAERSANGTVTRIQLDTYEREIERYGGLAGVELAEELFYRDSEACVRLLAICEDDPELRWQLTLVGIDQYFDDFALSAQARAKLVSSILPNLRSAAGATTTSLRAIGKKHRRYASRLAALSGPRAPSHDASFAEALTRAREVYDERSVHVRRVAVQLAHLRREGILRMDDTSLLSSFAHMHAVRMLGPSARRYELVLYDFLRRRYATLEARAARAQIVKTEPLRGHARG
jgi:thiopeptide-type bacteriocin biosynthesis protein